MKKNGRILILLLVFLSMFSILAYRLWQLQIVNGQRYADEFAQAITKSVRVAGTRGNIYDCHGELLAYNRLVYSVTITDNTIYASNRQRQLSLNSSIYHVIKKLTEQGEKVDHGLKLEIDSNHICQYTVTGSARARFQADIFGEADPEDMTEAQKNISAEDLLKYLASEDGFALYGEGKKPYSSIERKSYGLPETFTKEEMLAVVGVRYMLSLYAYRKYMPVVIAYDVSKETAVYIQENSLQLPGFDIVSGWERVYTGGEAFAHILGYTGEISAEEWEEFRALDDKYSMNSVVGKIGIEKEFEDVLQGEDGEKQVMVDHVGRPVGNEVTRKEEVSGRDVYLSIDKELQTEIYSILERKLAEILTENMISAKRFDKTSVSDASDIRIPVYNVYLALVENQILSLDKLFDYKASDVEKEIAEKLLQKRRDMAKQLHIELSGRTSDIGKLSEEMQDSLFYLVEESGLLDKSAVDTSDLVYVQWNRRNTISIREFLLYAIKNGWIASGTMDSIRQYTASDELYQFLIQRLERELEENQEYNKRLLRYMLYEDRITGVDICKLLYEQGILDKADGDYERLIAGRLDAFSLIKKKIAQLEITPAQLALDPCSASAVVVESATGKVLACVSYPGYDNNRLANHVDGQYYNRLLNDASLPLYNRATQQQTAPGSTFKPVTILAGLTEGVISTETAIVCDGTFDKVEPVLKCWNRFGHGNITDAAAAIQHSCNDYLCETMYRLGTAEDGKYSDSKALVCLQRYASLLYLDKKSGIEITESKPQVTDAYGIPSAIGQGTHNYTTVQLARYMNVLATEGELFSLSLIKGISDQEGNLVQTENIPIDYAELPDSAWAAVKEGLTRFAQSNTALKDRDYTIAGKTGTAQESAWKPDHALFVGYAPAEKPEIAIAVRIVNGYGSSYATSAGRDIFDYYFGGLDEQSEKKDE